MPATTTYNVSRCWKDWSRWSLSWLWTIWAWSHWIESDVSCSRRTVAKPDLPGAVFTRDNTDTPEWASECSSSSSKLFSGDEFANDWSVSNTIWTSSVSDSPTVVTECPLVIEVWSMSSWFVGRCRKIPQSSILLFWGDVVVETEVYPRLQLPPSSLALVLTTLSKHPCLGLLACRHDGTCRSNLGLRDLWSSGPFTHGQTWRITDICSNGIWISIFSQLIVTLIVQVTPRCPRVLKQTRLLTVRKANQLGNIVCEVVWKDYITSETGTRRPPKTNGYRLPVGFFRRRPEKSNQSAHNIWLCLAKIRGTVPQGGPSKGSQRICESRDFKTLVEAFGPSPAWSPSPSLLLLRYRCAFPGTITWH